MSHSHTAYVCQFVRLNFPLLEDLYGKLEKLRVKIVEEGEEAEHVSFVVSLPESNDSQISKYSMKECSIVSAYDVMKEGFNINIVEEKKQIVKELGIETTPNISHSQSQPDYQFDIKWAQIMDEDNIRHLGQFIDLLTTSFETYESFIEYSKLNLNLSPRTANPTFKEFTKIFSERSENQGVLLIAPSSTTPYLYGASLTITHIIILFRIKNRLCCIVEELWLCSVTVSNIVISKHASSQSEDNINNVDSIKETSTLIELDNFGISQFSKSIQFGERNITGYGVISNIGKVFVKLSETRRENSLTMNKVKDISHPNICQIFKYEEVGPILEANNIPNWNGNITITAMECLKSMDDIYLENTSNFCKFAKTVLIGCLKGLECLHANDIIHCDISVHNIMFRSCEEPVIIDMNNSIVTNAPKSIMNNVYYKDDYSPPDKSLRFTTSHDLYSLAVVFVKLTSRHVRYFCCCTESVLEDVEYLQAHFENTEINYLFHVIMKMVNCTYHCATTCLDDILK